MTVRTRFSPSPTGKIHIGNARAALFAALYAAQEKGHFVLRIEDTDQARSSTHFIELLQQDLHWLGIYWQEGPDVGGEYAPYAQSQRQTIYDTYYQLLTEQKRMYPCFCTEQELMLARKLQLSRGQAPRYSGKCLALSETDVNNKLAQGMVPAWRFQVPKDTNVLFTDIVKGEQQMLSRDMGDFIIRRADGTAPFLFCNAIDDATMKVTHVLRGEDHLSNTFRQIMLLQSLNLSLPQYGHLSLIVGEDGAPLSKRHGSFSVNDLRTQGYLPAALINYLTRLGHTMEVQTLLPFADLAKHFQLTRLSKSPARFDLVQLLYWQKMAVQALTEDDFWDWLGNEMRGKIPADKQSLFRQTIQANIAFPQEAEQWLKILFGRELHLDQAEIAILNTAGNTFFATAQQAVNQHGTDLKVVLDQLKTTLNVQGKKLFMPLRIALTGQQHGPELQAITTLLGKEKTLQRLQFAKDITS